MLPLNDFQNLALSNKAKNAIEIAKQINKKNFQQNNLL